MATRNIGGILTEPTSPKTSVVVRKRHLNTVFVSGTGEEAVYKMRGWDSGGLAYYYWTTSNPAGGPPAGAPSLVDIVIAATLIEA